MIFDTHAPKIVLSRNRPTAARPKSIIPRQMHARLTPIDRFATPTPEPQTGNLHQPHAGRFADSPAAAYPTASLVAKASTAPSTDIVLSLQEYLSNFASPHFMPVAKDILASFLAPGEEPSFSELYPLQLGLGEWRNTPCLAPENKAEALLDLFDSTRGNLRESFDVLGFFYNEDWKKKSFYRLLNANEHMDLLLGRQWLHATTGRKPFRDTPLAQRMMIGEPLHNKEPIHEQKMDEHYAFQICQGEAENSLGLEFRLTHNRHFIGKIGVEYTHDTIHILNIQGGLHCREQVREFQEKYGQHPFDWLITAIIKHAHHAGFSHVRGYGYQHNASIMQHLAQNDISTTEQTFGRMYNGRFKKMKFKPHDTLSNIYVFQTTQWQERESHTNIGFGVFDQIPE